MILEISAMIGATAAAAGLVWRLLKAAKHDGVSSLLATRANETLLHVCLLFALGMFMRAGLNVLLHSAPAETMAGFGALFGGMFIMCLVKMKTRSASITTRGNHG